MSVFIVKTPVFTLLIAYIFQSLVLAIPFSYNSSLSTLSPRSCENTATSRSCWGDYDINTDYYSVIPQTGITREYWLSIENSTIAPDGVSRSALTFNGTLPGPSIIADWGDDLIIHMTNQLQHNGTSVHWHGIRQLNTNEYDGVPGVTQCPIAPGDSMTYKFHADQYGSTWYHSHFSLQYGDGLYGPLIINGPATADYDEDLGVLFLSDWAHQSVFEIWDSARVGAPPALDTGLINGTNTYNGGGKKFETTFVSGKKYRIRVINVAIEGHFQFSIDGHSLQVIANDLVPIVPYDTDSLLVSIGQRYDVIVEANATPGDYWLRGGWLTACDPNNNAPNITGIVRYDPSSTAELTSTGIVPGSNCGDEPLASLVPHLASSVGNYSGITEEDLGIVFGNVATWTLNSSSLYLNWSDPTNLRIAHSQSVFPTDYNVIPLDRTNTSDWALYVIQDQTGLGLYHPIHLHGHDFYVVSQTTSAFSSSNMNLINPPRRDVASLPGGGSLAIAFKLDNPGSWLMHCHIAWHASEGFAIQFIESESEITGTMTNTAAFTDSCNAWTSYTPTEAYTQDDSGI